MANKYYFLGFLEQPETAVAYTEGEPPISYELISELDGKSELPLELVLKKVRSTKAKTMKNLFLFAISTLLLGCSNNTFYLDEETGVLHPCGTSKITSIFITDQNQNYTSVIADWEDASSSLSLFDISPAYDVKDELGNSKNFKLEANKAYFVLHSTHGDASSYTLTFSTDANRHIIKNSSSPCSM